MRQETGNLRMTGDVRKIEDLRKETGGLRKGTGGVRKRTGCVRRGQEK